MVEENRESHWVWGPGDLELTSRAIDDPTPPTLGDLARAFLRELGERHRPIRLVPYRADEWFRGAFSTMQRVTPKLSPEQKFRLHERLLAFAGSGLEPYEFRGAFDDLLTDLTKIAPLTVGQAQKLASIFLKYGFAVTHAEPDEHHPMLALVSLSGDCFPAPIDRIALRKLRAMGHHPRLGLRAGGESIQDETGEWVRWSRLNCRRTYWLLQDLITERAGQAQLSPLHYEMQFLWPANTKG